MRNQLIIGFAGKGNRLGRLEDLHAGRAEEDDLPGDAGRIHVGEALGAEVLDAPGERRGALAAAEEEPPQAAEARVPRFRLLLKEPAVALEDLLRRPGLF